MILNSAANHFQKLECFSSLSQMLTQNIQQKIGVDNGE